MGAFLRRHIVAIAYFIVCAVLVLWMRIDCIDARDIGMVMCGYWQYSVLFYALMPSTALIDVLEANPLLLQPIYDNVPHAETVLLLCITAVNALLLAGIVKLVRRLRSPR